MKKSLLIAALFLAGCKPTDRPADLPLGVHGSERFTVSVAGTFADELAYGGYRSIYVVRDKSTGQEYLGVSGVGISELGSHQTGKMRTGDER